MEEGWYKLKREKRRGEKTRNGKKKWIFDKILLYICTREFGSPLSADRSKLNISQEIQGRADLDISR